jgi:putative SOS response-associated peptidase YedK
MCGRYTIGTSVEALAARFHVQVSASLLSPSYNAAPSQGLPAILSANPQTITLSMWGFLPEWADGRPDVKPLINARAETVATKPFFKQAFRTKRCLVLADGFYEWKRTGRGKAPYRIALKTEEPFAFAGIWSTVHDAQGRPVTTFAIITTEANALVGEIHNRMPVILHPGYEAAWVSPENSPEQAQALLRPYAADLMSAYEVSRKVNSPAYNSPELLQRIAPAAPDGTSRKPREAAESGVLFASSAVP